MRDLIEELLSLHKTAQADRSKFTALQIEQASVLEKHQHLVDRCRHQEQQIAKLQEMIASKNAAVAKELGLHTAYHKSLQQASGIIVCPYIK